MLVLGVETVEKQPVINHFELKGDTIWEIYLSFQQNLNSLTKQLTNCTHPECVKFVGQSMLDLNYQYSTYWQCFESEQVETKVSVFPDPMLIYTELKKANDSGNNSANELLDYSRINSPALFMEGKRLSLLHQMEKEWRTSSQS
jgi:hypothetical protein